MYAIFKHTDKIQFIGHAENLEQFHNLVGERGHIFDQEDGRILDQGGRWLNESEFTLDFGDYRYEAIEPQDLTSDEIYAGITDPAWDFERPKVEYNVERWPEGEIRISFSLKKESLSKFIDIEPEALSFKYYEGGDELYAHVIYANPDSCGSEEYEDAEQEKAETIEGHTTEIWEILQQFEKQGFEIPNVDDIMNEIQSDIADAISGAWEIEEA